MPSFHSQYEFKKYRIDLDIKGEAVGYAVEVNARGKGPAERTLWTAGNGKPMPQRMRAVLSVPGTLDSIAYVMGGA